MSTSKRTRSRWTQTAFAGLTALSLIATASTAFADRDGDRDYDRDDRIRHDRYERYERYDDDRGRSSRKVYTVEGRLFDVDRNGNQFMLDRSGGRDLGFVYDRSTRITRHGERVSDRGLDNGRRATVEYVREGRERYAIRIDIASRR